MRVSWLCALGFQLFGTLIGVQAIAQSPSCDSPEGSGSCLPWGRTVITGLPGEIVGLSADGTTIVGVSNDETTTFQWQLGSGVSTLLIPGASRTAAPDDRKSISANGSVIVGEVEIPGDPDPDRIFRWDVTAGTHELLPAGLSTEGARVAGNVGDFDVLPRGVPTVSADGTTVVGTGTLRRSVTGTVVGTTDDWPFLWLSGAGTTDSPQIPFATKFVPNAVSGDATSIIGTLAPVGVPPFSVRNLGGVAETIVSEFSEPTAVTHSGSYVAGKRNTPTFDGFRWTSGQTLRLLEISVVPRAISDDGRVVAARSNLVGGQPNNLGPYVYMDLNFSSDGRPLQDVLTSGFSGFDLSALPYGSGMRLPAALVSGDGTVFSFVGSNAIAKVTPLNYLALGDSYSSGEGVPKPHGINSGQWDENGSTGWDGTNECHRSRIAYSSLAKPRTTHGQRTFRPLSANNDETPAYSTITVGRWMVNSDDRRYELSARVSGIGEGA